mmetsp:Transcript_144/g.172  ORF Transcript_144/g.172 Transcript_144/m.172 type:complete len:126 (+) Transcript_144:39-416(+)|eukprot:CAMPEP_0114354642 /NCGR_PEP_ID=MMETSP0101-20121206/19624_1 /TAXON_ID=38822 ORGANISM="Pteridomonas danica, Strain PT" /NCGR_SAMPLE_ID=MMETSP0101 /ASSEMBLY_ACC=CAM_ASM_000211 /LENGTH=125 /DNA_ID=CAMNT_0001496195 /DNA_START=25 /DNA_END=402 /DNA_ORIENTATION=-
MPTIAERAAMQQAAKAQKMKEAQEKKEAEEAAELARMGKPKINTGKIKRPSDAAVTTAFSKGAADEQEAKAAADALNRRQNLQDKTAAALARKKERMDQQAKMREDTATLNATTASLYGTEPIKE